MALLWAACSVEEGRVKILVATPVMRGELYKRSWLSWYAMDWDHQVDYFQMIGGDHDPLPYDNVTRKYNDARRTLLAGNYDALMTIESDTIVPKDALRRLVAVDADVAYGLYAFRHGFPTWSAFTVVRKDKGLPISIEPEKARAAWGKVIDVEGVGNGCTLIRRHVMEALEFKWSPGEFGCCDWHLSLDCQEKGFTQKCDLGLVCGHIGITPVYRIIWPDPDAKGLYRTQLLETWEPLPTEDKWLTGKEITVKGDMKVRVLHRFHWEGPIYKNPGEVIGVSEEVAERLISKGIAEPYKKGKSKAPKVKIDEPDVPEEILKPGWTEKTPCDEADEDCLKKKGRKKK